MESKTCRGNIRKIKPKGYWTKELCHQQALLFEYRTEFHDNSLAAYDFAMRNKWLDDICSHMNHKGSLKFRYVYSFEFDDNHVYIGLTWNIENRYTQHLLDSHETSVKKYINKSNSNFKFKVLTDQLNEKDATIMEQFFIGQYKNNGWSLINKIKGGGLGKTKIIWTKEKCTVEVEKYITRDRLRIYSYNCFRALLRNNWMKDVFPDDIYKKPKGYWNKERCQLESIKYNRKVDFKKKSKVAYQSACKFRWINDICKHMILN